MASRRRSVMPTTNPQALAISRRTSMQGMKPPAPAAKVPARVQTKLVPGSKPRPVTKVAASNVDDFVSAENFDFQIASSPMGPMTRARRSSIYHRPTSKAAAAAPKRGRVAVSDKIVEENLTPKLVSAEKKPTPKSTSAASRSTLRPKPKTPASTKLVVVKSPEEVLKLRSPPKLEVESGASGKISPKNKPMVQTPQPKVITKTPVLRIAKIDTPIANSSSPIASRVMRSARRRTPARTVTKKTPMPARATAQNVVSWEADENTAAVAPAPKSGKKTATSLLKEIQAGAGRQLGGASSNVPPTFTPQALDPRKLLRKTLKTKVENQIDSKVLNLPKGSPYTLMRGFTENGSPAEELVKLSFLPSRAEAVKFMTATPAPMKRLRSAKVELEHDSIGNVRDFVSTPVTTKRKLSMSFEDDNDENVEHVAKKAKTETSMTKLQPVVDDSQLMTGGLGKICAIM